VVNTPASSSNQLVLEFAAAKHQRKQMQTIVPGVHTFAGLLLGRAYAIEDADGLTLIDTGLGLAATKVLQQLQASGRSASGVKRILITHAHPDHIGGLAKLQAATGAQVVAHALEWPIMASKVSETPRSTSPVRREVQGGERLAEVLGGLRVIFTPGHTRGHVCFWQPDRRLLFCGDVVLRLPKLCLPFAPFTVDMDEDKRSIKKIAELNAEVVFFGHGQPLTHDAAAQLRDFAAKF
jgi:glyoxylase-like metal-dependent hydrolase (beta-lactamase superfamily II)